MGGFVLVGLDVTDLQIRDTVDFDMPESTPSALTRSSTLRVDVPLT